MIWLDGLAVCSDFSSYVSNASKCVYGEVGLLRVAKIAEYSAVALRGWYQIKLFTWYGF